MCFVYLLPEHRHCNVKEKRTLVDATKILARVAYNWGVRSLQPNYICNPYLTYTTKMLQCEICEPCRSGTIIIVEVYIWHTIQCIQTRYLHSVKLLYNTSISYTSKTTAAGGFKKHSLLLLQNAADDLGCGAPSLTFPQTHNDCSTLYNIDIASEFTATTTYLWVVVDGERMSIVFSIVLVIYSRRRIFWLRQEISWFDQFVGI